MANWVDALIRHYQVPRSFPGKEPGRFESVFATVRHRTIRTKGCLSHTTAVAMVFKLIIAAARSWRVLKGSNQLPKCPSGDFMSRTNRLAGDPS